MDSFTFNCEHIDDEDDTVVGSVEYRFQTDGHLSDMLYNFKTFLQSCGYNYVTNVYAIKSDGQEVGEE